MIVRTSRTSQPLCASLAIAMVVALGAGCKDSQPVESTAQTQVQSQTPAPVQAPGQTTTDTPVQTPTPAVQAPVVSQTQPQPVTKERSSAPVQKQPKSTVKEQPVAEVVTERPVVLAVGTALSGNLTGTVSTDKSNVGDAVALVTTEPVVVDGKTVVPVGSTVHGTVTHVRAAGRVKGASEITVRFTELEVAGGKRFPITCEPYRRVAKGDGRESAAEIGGATAVGGILGGVLGGKGGALKGGALGAAVGTGVAVATKGEQVVIPAGHSLKVTLTAPVTLVSGENS